MKVIETYECEICTQTYKTAIKATTCENSHVPPEHMKIVETNYSVFDTCVGYPETIAIESHPGEPLRGIYKFVEIQHVVRIK